LFDPIALVSAYVPDETPQTSANASDVFRIECDGPHYGNRRHDPRVPNVRRLQIDSLGEGFRKLNPIAHQLRDVRWLDSSTFFIPTAGNDEPGGEQQNSSQLQA
jgi:hypothetical protein